MDRKLKVIINSIERIYFEHNRKTNINFLKKKHLKILAIKIIDTLTQ